MSRSSQRFAISVGSGKFGQTYLYWSDDRLYQRSVDVGARVTTGGSNVPSPRDSP